MFRVFVFTCFLLLVSHRITVSSQDEPVVDPPADPVVEETTTVADIAAVDVAGDVTTADPAGGTLSPGLTTLEGTGDITPETTVEVVTGENSLSPDLTTVVVDVSAAQEETTTTESPSIVDDLTTTVNPDDLPPPPAPSDVGAPVVIASDITDASETTESTTVLTILIVPNGTNVVTLPPSVPVFRLPAETTTDSDVIIEDDEVPGADELDTTTFPAPNTTTTTSGAVILPVVVVTSRTTTKAVVAAAAAAQGRPGWFLNYALLIFAGIMILGIILAMLYACCCMKAGAGERRVSIVKGSISDGRDEIITIARPIDQLNKSNKYVDEVITSHQYRETKREPFTAAPSFTPNNSFANAATATSVVNRGTPAAPVTVVTEQKVAKTVTVKSTPDRVIIPIGAPLDASPRSAPAHSIVPPSGTQYNYITPRHIDQSYIHPAPHPQSWNDRRLEPSLSAPVSSRDVIVASRVNNAVVSVAAASNTPLRGSPRPTRLDGDDSRNSTLERSVSPTGKPVYRTTINITPQHNRDPNEPVEQGNEEVLPYSQYVHMIKGPTSDFSQYSPDRQAPRERRRDEENTESQV